MTYYPRTDAMMVAFAANLPGALNRLAGSEGRGASPGLRTSRIDSHAPHSVSTTHALVCERVRTHKMLCACPLRDIMHTRGYIVAQWGNQSTGEST